MPTLWLARRGAEEVTTGMAAGRAGIRRHGSTLIAAAMVAAAGAIAWFGGARHSDMPAEQGEPVTVAGPERDNPPTAAYRTVSNGGLPTRVVVPSAGIDAPVVEVGVVLEGGEAKWETSWTAVGHHLDSAMPGQPGNMVLSGHVSVANRAHRAWFATLNRVREGDVVEVYAGEQGYRYVVEWVGVVDPDAVDVLRSDAAATVTLVTCTRDLKHRLVVVGRLAGEAEAPARA